jgi:hypothetical protein
MTTLKHPLTLFGVQIELPYLDAGTDQMSLILYVM